MNAAVEDAKQKGVKKGRRIKLGAIVILCFMTLYIPSLIHWVFGENIGTDIIRMGELEESVNTDAYFMRDEQVLKSPFSGRCILEVSEGDKVASKHRIAMVVNPSYEKLVEKLKTLDMDILKRQKQLNIKENFFSQDLVKIDDDIAEKLNGIIGECSGNSLVKARDYKESIDNLIQKKVTVTGGNGHNDPVMKNKRQERSELQDQINKNRQEIISQKSGIISYIVDGNESLLNPRGLADITPAMLKKIKHTENSSNSAVINVKAGKPFAKIINDIEYSIVASLDTVKADAYTVDSKVWVRINETGRLLDGVVDFKSEDMGGKSIVAVTVDQGLSETSSFRTANIDLIRKSYHGLKVPLKSLIRQPENMNTATLALVDANYTEFVKVKILGTDSEFAIIENIEDKNWINKATTADLYDTFVVNPKNIKEGQLIK